MNSSLTERAATDAENVADLSEVFWVVCCFPSARSEPVSRVKTIKA